MIVTFSLEKECHYNIQIHISNPKDSFHNNQIIKVFYWDPMSYLLKICLYSFFIWTTNRLISGVSYRQKMITAIFQCNGEKLHKRETCVLPTNKISSKRHQEKYPHESLVFNFTICEQLIHIFMSQHHISKPDSSIAYDDSENSIEIPIYREDISQQLDKHYSGEMRIKSYIFAFSGHQSKTMFTGITFYYDAVLEMTCNIDVLQLGNESECFICEFMSSDVLPFNITEESLIITSDQIFKRDLNNDFQLGKNKGSLSENIQNMNQKSKRSANQPRPLSCFLHLVADHLFFKYVGNGNMLETVNAMFNAVNDADAVFRSTDFDSDGQGDNIGFMVGKVTIYQNQNTNNYTLGLQYATSKEYLEQFSYHNFEEYCLAIAFTFRDFNGAAGTSYPASSNPRIPGGICQRRLYMNGRNVSLNTLAITFMTNTAGKASISERSRVMLTLIHELSHSMGARHDDKYMHDEKCSTFNTRYGNFIMSEQSNFQMNPNYQKFSNCSLRAMAPVIKRKGICLHHKSIHSVCGDGIPDAGEECDCGLSHSCASIDPCCTPADVINSTDKPCTIRKSENKTCSPRQSPCCNTDCQYLHQKSLQRCNILGECVKKAFCDGRTKHCPRPKSVPSGTSCNDGHRMCVGSQCLVDVCAYNNLESCTCVKNTERCRSCCKEKNSLLCQPAETFGIVNANQTAFLLELGRQCSPGMYCDGKSQCQIPSKSETSYSSVDEFLTFLEKYWLYIIFLFVSVIFLISVIRGSLKDNPVSFQVEAQKKMQSLCNVGKIEANAYQTKISEVEQLLDKHVPEIFYLDFDDDIGRLSILFPSVTEQELLNTVKEFHTERAVVEQLLLKGYPIRTFHNFQPHHTKLISSADNNRAETVV